MNAPFDRLHAGLSDLAEQVTVVDLRDRALRTSRRLGVQRALLATAAAVVVLAVGAGTAFAVLPQRHSSPPGGPGGSTGPSALPSSAPSPSAAAPSTTPSTPPADPVPGMYLYRLDTADGKATNDIVYRPAGGDWRTVGTVKQPPSVSATLGLIVVSPDHQHLAWILNGKLQISAFDGSQVKTVTSNVGNLACQAPTWSADGRHLLFTTIADGGHGNTVQVVNIDGTGRHSLGTSGSALGCVYASADGAAAYAAVADASGKMTLVAFDGGATPRTVAATWPSGRSPLEVVAAETGSTRILVATASSSNVCGCNPPEWYAVLDTATGKATGLDETNYRAGTARISGAFTADGRAVVIANHDTSNTNKNTLFLTVYGTDGAVVGSAPLPSMGYAYLVGVDG